ncbi:hypothetical protein TPHA_0D02500 [Tetrapisispora phaffii CBS 4417]|uniref:EamA domain-containing protein n=1 Tax=Tetrapisispora phaffii (strain ATCC 24235 / CBS 4417 / NBRC 1672 / NRRL Y-8282 / UCD 70-5) TaxID=1071381 RepID=G8BSR6_TETPH|nr:hypothetical protein TPHA_0D02500 [Tetrapisispora phaffii CBS 4417]CCE62887.1 hypothetical protein TPHA_0D02500 [Tetrapisispora phaffii CBS 4417]
MSTKTLNNKRWSMGLIMLSAVVVLWVLSSFLINIIFRDNSYRKPFLITYINTVSFIFYLLPLIKTILVNFYYNGVRNEIPNILNELIIAQEGPDSTTVNPLHPEPSGASNVSSVANDIAEGSSQTLPNEATSLLSSSSKDDTDSKQTLTPKNRMTLKETILLSLEFCSLWFLANLMTNSSLAYTSVASQTILSSTSSFFTLFIGYIWNIEKITKSKTLGSLVSFIGIILVTHSDYYHYDDNYPPRTNPHSSLITFAKEIINILTTSDNDEEYGNSPFRMFIGNLLALAGALLYSVYSILLKKKVQDESRLNMHVFFGFVGFFTLVLFWPVIVLLQYYGWETIELPPTNTIAIIVLINCLITFVSDYCWANAMLLTTPLTVTVGLSLTIPLAMFGDLLFVNKKMNWVYIFGAILIMGSFFVINNESGIEQNELSEQQEQQNSQSQNVENQV